VSQHVAKLEREVGAVLLERSGRRVLLTAAGEVLLEHARRLLTGLDDARRELAAVARSDAGRLRLDLFPSAAVTFAPAAVARLLAAYPKVNVAMHELDPPKSLPRVLSGETDLAVVYEYPLLGCPRDPRLTCEVIGTDAMAVAVPVDGALAARSAITLAELGTHAWVAPGPSVCRDALDEACRRAGFAPTVVSQTNDYHAMLRMVGAGVGIAVVPRIAAAMGPTGSVVLRPLAGSRLKRVIVLAHRARAALTTAMDLMRTLMAQAAEEATQVPDAREVVAA
jgi:DNA-binding transcriptional LysR family regulator